MRLDRRLTALEATREHDALPAPGLVLLPCEGGFLAEGQVYGTVEAAQAAHPDRQGPLVLVEIKDCSEVAG